ncbi:hypothetical protein EDB19DRAFT_1742061 [Suillus lakei]|nr:hypothetical protein EDB19DRAFT_1742061 [Suillus lakei]
MGTISGTLTEYNHACVIWMDTHADIHISIVQSADRGHIYAMLISFLLNFNLPVPALRSLVFISLRDVYKPILMQHLCDLRG